MTVSDLCRVTVQTHRNGQSVAVDLALPTRLALGEVLPCVVDIVGDRPAAESGHVTEHWAMARVGGGVLDQSMTLHENGVRDGEILLLTTQSQISRSRFGEDICHFVVDASAPADRDGWISRRMAAVAVCGPRVGVRGARLVRWFAGEQSRGDRGTRGTGGCSRVDHGKPCRSGTAGRVDPGSDRDGVRCGRRFPDSTRWPRTTESLSGGGNLRRGVDGVAPCHLRRERCFLAIAAFSTMAAIAAAVASLWPTPTATVGAVLGAVSLAMLGVAARLAIVLTGLSPKMPLSPGESSDDGVVPAGAGAARAELGHRSLTGLLAGLSASAALGAVLVAADQRDESALSGLCFTTIVSAVLLLRACQQRGTVRSAVVFGGGMVSASAVFTLAAISLPGHAHWVCLIAVIVGAGALFLTLGNIASRISPVARRSLELLDYFALASVVPLACWVGDVFGIVRGLSLT